jgi:signal transduction histidine kinase
MYISDFIKLWLVFWGIINFPMMKKKSSYIKMGIIQSIVLVVSGILYRDFIDAVNSLIAFMVVIAICFLFQGNFFRKLAYSLLAYILVLFLDTCIVSIASLLVNASWSEFISTSVIKFVYNFINIVTISFFVIIKKLIYRKTLIQLSISKRIYTLLFTGVGTGFLILSGLMVRTVNGTSERARKLMVIVTIIVVITYCAACLMMIIISESRDSYKALSLINQSVIESQQQYYNLVYEKQQEIRSIRHEIKNHLACINSLYKSNKLQEMELYIHQLIETADLSEDLFDTGNDIVNAILNDAQSRYKKDRIIIRLEGGFPSVLSIAAHDLCVIFANVVTNAIEAILRMEKYLESVHYIDIRISSYKDDLFIDISNPIDKQVEMHNGNLITSKKDKNLHGFGTKNVRQRAEKYQGSVNYHIENNKFLVEIQMKNKV